MTRKRQPEADHGDEPEQRLRGERRDQQRGGRSSPLRPVSGGSARPAGARRPRSTMSTTRPRPASSPSARPRALVRPRRTAPRRSAPAAKRRPRAGPGLRPVQRLAAEHGRDRERERRRRRPREAGAEKQVEPPPVDREADPGQHRDDRRRERDRRVEHEPQLGQLLGAAQARVGDEAARGQRPAARRAAARRPSHDLVGVTFFAPHIALVGRRLRCR